MNRHPEGTAASADALPTEPAAGGLVDLIAAETQFLCAAGQPSIGLCIDERHPTFSGRVLIRLGAPGRERDVWLATLAHVPVRRDDRVLVIQPANWPEGLVLGVVDGLRPRSPVLAAAGVLALKDDEVIEVRDAQGAPLLAILPSPQGPVLKLAHRDQRIEVDGTLAIAADALAFTSRGAITLAAGGDVTVSGEQIALN
jgi:hypothetical protein